MTIGIYSLYWEEPDLTYIGQSVDIARRWVEHYRKLVKGTHNNRKMQCAYNNYGEPCYTIIEECSITDLNQFEVYWCNEFSKLGKLLNIAEPGEIVSSPLARHRKYSKFTILKVFSMLYKDLYSVEKIHIRTKVSTPTIKAIAAGNKHIWLKEEYPIQFNSMLQKVWFKHRTKSKGYILCPDGHGIEVLNLKDFCLTQDILKSNIKTAVAGISKLLKGNSASYKGYKRLQEN